jgi:hypothetical protein
MMAASANAAAQLQVHTTHGPTSGAATDSSRAVRERAANLKSIRRMGIAAKLNTTAEALAAAYERAQLTNPRLNRGRFIAANMLAANLGGAHPNITTQAMLSGLQSGRSIGQTLQSLGLSASQTKAATRTAAGQRKDAEQRAKAERKTAKQKAKHDLQGNRPAHR